MNKLRKPYVSFVLSLLILFISCQPQSINLEEQAISSKKINQNERITLENFVGNHISIINNYLLNPSYYNNNSTTLISDLENYVNYNNLVISLEDNNIETPEEFANMYLEVQKNINDFLTNFDYGKSTPKEVESLILTEIERQSNQSLEAKHLTCGDIYWRAMRRCDRNFYASLAAAAISAFWTLGLGTVVGISVAGAIGINCRLEARSDLSACVAQ